jgi:hypothetical protein
LCGALLCDTAGCVKFHCCLFIAYCRWKPALLCDTAGCVKCHCCLVIAYCRWNPALLCDTAGCVKCHCCLFIAYCRWNPRFVRLEKPAFCITVKSDYPIVPQTFLLADPFFFFTK